MLEIAMTHTTREKANPIVRTESQSVVQGRRSFSAQSKKVSNAFFIVFAQYERAFEELAKV